MNKFIFICLCSIVMMSCEQKPDFVEKSGKVYNYFTKEGEPGVEVCTEVPSQCTISDASGGFRFAYDINEYLLGEDRFSNYYNYTKKNVQFGRYDENQKEIMYAVPKVWMRVNISPDPPFTYFNIYTSAGVPDFPSKEVFKGQAYSEVYEITYWGSLYDGIHKNWWEDFVVGIKYFGPDGNYIYKFDTITLKSLDTVDVHFNF